MAKSDAARPIYPFRWDVTKRSQLGQLVGTPLDDRDTWLNWEEMTARTYRWYGRYNYSWFLNEMTRAIARVVALSHDSDLCFVGRSPESLFDYLSGLLFDTSWAERPALLHFSMYDTTEKEVMQEYPGALQEIYKYLTFLGLDPQSLALRERPIAFVDIVVSGGTLGNLISVINNWCRQTGCDWNAVRRKIRIVGLTERRETSPNTWRWQQHAEWVSMLLTGSIKNISIPEQLFHFFGAGQPKTTTSYFPPLWGDPQVTLPEHNQDRLRALKVATALFDDGRSQTNRTKFAAELSKQPSIRYPWFRSLILELKGQ